MDNAPRPPRRIRYKGTHPKSFKEKYKEHQPEKYAGEVEHIKSKGNTPAGMHRSICVNEILELLKPAPGMKGLDATLGYGGHSSELLQRIIPDGILYATDVDPMEFPKTVQRLNNAGYGDDVFKPRLMNFAGIDSIIAESGPLDFVLADLGVSSMQIDNPDRGFSLKHDGPLDLRLNPQKGKPASELLITFTVEELEAVFIDNADELYAQPIAVAVVESLRKGVPVLTTNQFRSVVKEALRFVPRHQLEEVIKKSCQRCFQALRIEVNNEFGVLDRFLEKLPDALAQGGRVAILSFHSGEDRRVKKSFQRFYREGIYAEVAPDPIRPTVEEVSGNPRARSAKLRWAVRGMN